MDCVAPALLAVAVLYELVAIPPAQWPERTVGNYAGMCLLAIPLLSIVPLVALLIALRAGAPRFRHRPVRSPGCWPAACRPRFTRPIALMIYPCSWPCGTRWP